MKIWKIIVMICIAVSILATMHNAFADDVTVTAEVSKSISATFNGTAAAFSSVDVGSSENAAACNADGTCNVTVDTNAPYDVSAEVTTELNDGLGHTITAGNLKMQALGDYSDFSYGSAVTLSTGSTSIASSLDESTTTMYHGFWLDVPSNAHYGSYTGTIAVTYSNAEG